VSVEIEHVGDLFAIGRSYLSERLKRSKRSKRSITPLVSGAWRRVRTWRSWGWRAMKWTKSELLKAVQLAAVGAARFLVHILPDEWSNPRARNGVLLDAPEPGCALVASDTIDCSNHVTFSATRLKPVGSMVSRSEERIQALTAIASASGVRTAASTLSLPRGSPESPRLSRSIAIDGGTSRSSP